MDEGCRVPQKIQNCLYQILIFQIASFVLDVLKVLTLIFRSSRVGWFCSGFCTHVCSGVCSVD